MLAESSVQNNQTFAIEGLLRNSAYPHVVTNLELLETHISWVILTGPFDYKIKKPVVFDFVDYQTLDRRKAFCEREVELNQRFAKDLYVGVVPIFYSNGEFKIGNELFRSDAEVEKNDSPIRGRNCTGNAVEYAVKMRQFPQQEIAATRLLDEKLTSAAVEQLGCRIAEFHDTIECAPPTSPRGKAERILADATGNFTMLSEPFRYDQRHELLGKLEQWTLDQFEKLRPDFSRRITDGKVRRCHGDLHLKNIVQWDGRLMPFDGIEFNEDFQWIDVLSEIAFPVMDFVARGRTDLAWRMLNAYLEPTGDYAGLPVLRFYLVYRAMVRAKVTWLNPKNKTGPPRSQNAGSSTSDDQLPGQWDKYLVAANYFAFEVKPTLSITHGFSGSGKSTIAMQVIDQEGGVRIRTDVERRRLAYKFKIQDKYSPGMNDRVYACLLELAGKTINSGIPVVIDGTFLKRNRRESFERLAAELNVPYSIIDCDATFDELCRRIRNRVCDPSEATIEVLKMQMESHDLLTPKEQEFVVK